MGLGGRLASRNRECAAAVDNDMRYLFGVSESTMTAMQQSNS